MGISKNQLQIAANQLASFTTEKFLEVSNKLNTTASIIDDINIAQKTVNTKGIKELLDSEILMTIGTSATIGTPTTTTINQNIDLKESITNYDFVNIQFTVKSTERKYNFPIKSINVKNIIYNNTDISLNDGSVILFEMNLPSGVPGSYGSLDIGFRGWFKSPTQLFIIEVINPMGDLYNIMSIQSIEGVKLENVIIDPVEYVNSTQGIEDTPVGNIISFMGFAPPKHYLNCDGSVYNITDYPYLSQHIKDQFGSFNFFGGDGTTTFAVPDLTDISSLTNVTPKMTSNILPAPYVASSSSEFTTNNQAYRAFDSTLSQPTFLLADGDITGFLKLDFGSEQSVSNFSLKSNSSTMSSTTAYMPKDFEIYGSNDNTNYTLINTYTNQTSWDFLEERQYSFNKIVKYRYYRLDILTNNGWASSGIPELTYFINSSPKISCIKYEPTYFMNIQGLIEETTLWEGNVGTSGTTRVEDSITLSNSFMNYDMLGVYFEFRNNEPSFRPQYKEIHPTQIDEVINSTITNSSISFTWGYGTTVNYTDIKKTSTYTRLDLAHYQSYIKKVIGYKYKTF